MLPRWFVDYCEALIENACAMWPDEDEMDETA